MCTTINQNSTIVFKKIIIQLDQSLAFRKILKLFLETQVAKQDQKMICRCTSITQIMNNMVNFFLYQFKSQFLFLLKKQEQINIIYDRNKKDEQYSDISTYQKQLFSDNLQIHENYFQASPKQNQQNSPHNPICNNNNSDSKKFHNEEERLKQNQQISEQYNYLIKVLISHLDDQITQLKDKLNYVTPVRKKYFQNMIQEVNKVKDREQCTIKELIFKGEWNPMDIKNIESLQRRVKDIGIEMDVLKDLENNQIDNLPSIYYNPNRESKQNNQFSQYLRRSNSASKLQTLTKNKQINFSSNYENQQIPQIKERPSLTKTSYNEQKNYKIPSTIHQQPQNINHHLRTQSVGINNTLQLNNHQNIFDQNSLQGLSVQYDYKPSSQIENIFDLSKQITYLQNQKNSKQINENKNGNSKIFDTNIFNKGGNDTLINFNLYSDSGKIINDEDEFYLSEQKSFTSNKKTVNESSGFGDEQQDCLYQSNKKQGLLSNNQTRKQIESHHSSHYSNIDEEFEKQKSNSLTPNGQKQYSQNNNSIETHNYSDLSEKKKQKQISIQKNDLNSSQFRYTKKQSPRKTGSCITTNCFSNSVPKSQPIQNEEEFLQTPQSVKQFDPFQENSYLSHNKHELNLQDSQDKNNSNFQQIVQSVKLNKYDTNYQQLRDQKINTIQSENDFEQNYCQQSQHSINIIQNKKISSCEIKSEQISQEYQVNQSQIHNNANLNQNQFSDETQVENNQNLYLDEIRHLNNQDQKQYQRYPDSNRSEYYDMSDSINTLNLDHNQISLKRNTNKENEVIDIDRPQKQQSLTINSDSNQLQPQGLNDINSFVSSQQRLSINTHVDQEQGVKQKNINLNPESYIGISHQTLNQDEYSYFSDQQSFPPIDQLKYENFLKEVKYKEQLQYYQNIPNSQQVDEIFTEKLNLEKDDNEIEDKQFQKELQIQSTHNQYTIKSTTKNVKENITKNNTEQLLQGNIKKSMKDNICNFQDGYNQQINQFPFREQNKISQFSQEQFQQNQSRVNEQNNMNKQYVIPNHQQTFDNKNNNGFNNNLENKQYENNSSNMQTICEVIERQYTNEISEKHLSPCFNESIHSRSMNQSNSQNNSYQNSQKKQQIQHLNRQDSTSKKINKNNDSKYENQDKLNQFNQGNKCIQSPNNSIELQQLGHEDVIENLQLKFNLQYPKYVLASVKARIFLTDAEYLAFLKNMKNSNITQSKQIDSTTMNEDSKFAKCEMVYLPQIQQIQLLFSSNLLSSSESNPSIVDTFSVSNINKEQLNLVTSPQNYLLISYKNQPTSNNKIILIQDNLAPITKNKIQDQLNQKRNLENLKQKILMIYQLRNSPQDLNEQLLQLKCNLPLKYSQSLSISENNNSLISENEQDKMRQEKKRFTNKIEEKKNDEIYQSSSQKQFNKQYPEQEENLKSEKFEILNSNQKQQNQLKNLKSSDKKASNEQIQLLNSNDSKLNENISINLINDHKNTNQKKQEPYNKTEIDYIQRSTKKIINEEMNRISNEKKNLKQSQIDRQEVIEINNQRPQSMSYLPNSIDQENLLDNVFNIKTNDGQSNLSIIQRQTNDIQDEDSLTNESHIKEFTNANIPTSIKALDNNNFLRSQLIEGNSNRQQNRKIQSKIGGSSANMGCSKYKKSQNYNRTPDEEDLIVFLKKFDEKEFIMKKYGQNSSSGQLRRIFFTSDFRFLCWKGVNSPQIKRIISVDTIKNYILHGRNSENFKRFKTKNQSEINCSFSIVLNNRTIDLEAQSIQDKEFFIHGLQVIFRSFL